jgi:hypothetical protein
MSEKSEQPPPPKYRRPTRAPTAADIEERDHFRKLATGSLPGVREAAEKWRTGLAALVTIITGGLLIKGPEAAGDLTTTWRIVLTILAGGGIAAAIYGLWRALKAAAGLPTVQQFEDIIDRYGSVIGYEIAQANTAAHELRQARIALMIALALLGTAVIAWWWSETEDPSPPAYVKVERTPPAAAVCGTLKSADNGRLRIQVSGEATPQTITLTNVKNLRLTTSC